MAKLKGTITAEEIMAEADLATDQPPNIVGTPSKPPGLSITMADQLHVDGQEAAVATAPAPGGPHACGLPMHFMEQASKARLAAYVAQYQYGQRERESLGITEAERELYRRYRATVGKLAISADFFVAALRMWRSGQFPIRRGPLLDLRTLKITSLEE